MHSKTVIGFSIVRVLVWVSCFDLQKNVELLFVLSYSPSCSNYLFSIVPSIYQLLYTQYLDNYTKFSDCCWIYGSSLTENQIYVSIIHCMNLLFCYFLVFVAHLSTKWDLYWDMNAGLSVLLQLFLVPNASYSKGDIRSFQ